MDSGARYEGAGNRGVRLRLLLYFLPAIGVLEMCSGFQGEPLSRSFRSMGTRATVTLRAASAGEIEQVTAEVRAIFDRLESDLSVYRSDSAVRRLAGKAGIAPMPVSRDTLSVLSLARHYGALTEGAFDVTVAPLVELWGFNGAQLPVAPPDESAIRRLLSLVDYRRVILSGQTAFLERQGMRVDLGGIAKGFAVDRAFEHCRSRGLEDFMIDLGGNIRCSGRPKTGEDWQIGVRSPFDRSRVLGKISLGAGMALATSGSYERFVEIGSKRYSHIIDPRTGNPVTGTAGATVLAPDAAAADALSTAFFVLGRNGAEALLRKCESAEVLLVPANDTIELWLSPGFARVFVPVPELSGSVRLFGARREI